MKNKYVYNSIAIFSIILLVSCSSDIVHDSNKANNSNLLIEDFESASTDSVTIHTHNNFPQGELSQLSESFLESSKESRYLNITCTLDQGEYQWAPYASITLSQPSGFNGSSYDGIRYRYRGDSHFLYLETSDITDNCWHQYHADYSDEWRTVTLSFEREINQDSWGIQTPFKPENISQLSWRLVGESGDTGSLSIDQIEFISSIPYENQYDMQILPPEIPERVQADQWNNASQVQQRVDSYLGRGVNLHNWLEANEPWDGVFKYDRSDIERYASQGFTAVRFPIDLDLWVVNRDDVVAGTKSFQIDSTLFSIIDSMESWTAQNNLSLTIDYHQYDGSLNKLSVDDSGYRKMVAELWKSVAHYYASNEREDLFYELTNEPGISESFPNSSWREMANEILDSIRSVDQFHSVLYGEARWYDRDVLMSSELFASEDTNIIYIFHYYEPFVFTHQGASWADQNETKQVPFPYSEDSWSTEFSHFGVLDNTPRWIKNKFHEYHKFANSNTIYNDIAEMKNWAVANGVPIICNELGVYDKSSQLQDRVNWFTTIGEIFSELEIGYAIWFGQYDKSGNLIPGIAEPLGLNE